MIAVRVLGHSDAGKTTLIERLVPALAGRGRVATIKSIHHPVELDEEGKDTHRHRTAGAERVIGITPTLTASFETRGKDDYEKESDALADLLSDLREDGYGYVLVEGFATATSLPAIVVGEREDGAENQAGILAHVEDARSTDVEELTARIDDLNAWSEGP
ncbi:MAG: molybdopterin-guanine dinucleotide biosynthesis protein B [Halobacteriales archaeon]